MFNQRNQRDSGRGDNGNRPSGNGRNDYYEDDNRGQNGQGNGFYNVNQNMMRRPLNNGNDNRRNDGGNNFFNNGRDQGSLFRNQYGDNQSSYQGDNSYNGGYDDNRDDGYPRRGGMPHRRELENPEAFLDEVSRALNSRDVARFYREHQYLGFDRDAIRANIYKRGGHNAVKDVIDLISLCLIRGNNIDKLRRKTSTVSMKRINELIQRYGIIDRRSVGSDGGGASSYGRNDITLTRIMNTFPEVAVQIMSLGQFPINGTRIPGLPDAFSWSGAASMIPTTSGYDRLFHLHQAWALSFDKQINPSETNMDVRLARVLSFTDLARKNGYPDQEREHYLTKMGINLESLRNVSDRHHADALNIVGKLRREPNFANRINPSNRVDVTSSPFFRNMMGNNGNNGNFDDNPSARGFGYGVTRGDGRLTAIGENNNPNGGGYNNNSNNFIGNPYNNGNNANPYNVGQYNNNNNNNNGYFYNDNREGDDTNGRGQMGGQGQRGAIASRGEVREVARSHQNQFNANDSRNPYDNRDAGFQNQFNGPQNNGMNPQNQFNGPQNNGMNSQPQRRNRRRSEEDDDERNNVNNQQGQNAGFNGGLFNSGPGNGSRNQRQDDFSNVKFNPRGYQGGETMDNYDDELNGQRDEPQSGSYDDGGNNNNYDDFFNPQDAFRNRGNQGQNASQRISEGEARYFDF